MLAQRDAGKLASFKYAGAVLAPKRGRCAQPENNNASVDATLPHADIVAFVGWHGFAVVPSLTGKLRRLAIYPIEMKDGPIHGSIPRKQDIR